MEIYLHVAPRPVPPVCSSYKYGECLFTVDSTHLTPLIFSLLTMPSLDLNQPIDWDGIEEFEGGILDLSYDFVWDPGNEGTHSRFLFLCFDCVPMCAFPSVIVQRHRR